MKKSLILLWIFFVLIPVLQTKADETFIEPIPHPYQWYENATLSWVSPELLHHLGLGEFSQEQKITLKLELQAYLRENKLKIQKEIEEENLNDPMNRLYRLLRDYHWVKEIAESPRSLSHEEIHHLEKTLILMEEELNHAGVNETNKKLLALNESFQDLQETQKNNPNVTYALVMGSLLSSIAYITIPSSLLFLKGEVFIVFFSSLYPFYNRKNLRHESLSYLPEERTVRNELKKKLKHSLLLKYWLQLHDPDPLTQRFPSFSLESVIKKASYTCAEIFTTQHPHAVRKNPLR